MKAKLKQLFSNMAVRIIVSVTVLLIFFSGIVSSIGYINFSEALTREYTSAAFRTAETAAVLVNADHFDQYLADGGNNIEYQNSLRFLDILCQKQDTTFVYVIRPDTSDYGHFTSIFNVVNEKSPYSPWEIGYVRETTNDEYRRCYQEIYEEGAERRYILRTANLGGNAPHITMLIPVRDSAGEVAGVLCVQREMAELNAGLFSYIKWILFALIICSIVVSTLSGMYFSEQFVNPIRTVVNETRRFSKENTVVSEEVLTDLSSIAEIETLANAIYRMEQDNRHYMDNLTAATAEKERIGTELSLATRIQASMLPSTFPAFPDRKDFDIYASMTPAKEVGGDFYDYFLLDGNRLGIVIADVSGKGVPAALFMMISMLLIHNISKACGSPAEVLTRVNAQICERNREEMFVTVWLGFLDLDTGRLTAANAGHEYPMLRLPDGSFELVRDKHGFVIGGMDGMRYKDYELDLPKGSTLFVYTDGVAEATDADNELFGTERTLDALNQTSGSDPQELIGSVRDAISEFVGDAPQFDDITMVCVRYDG